MKYGIGYRLTTRHPGFPSLLGVQCAAMRSWGLPLLFESSTAASEYGLRHYGKGYSLISERVATACCAAMVETVNGRRKKEVQPCTGEVVTTIDPTKLSYEQLLPLLLRCEQQAEATKLWRKHIKDQLLLQNPAANNKLSFHFS